MTSQTRTILKAKYEQGDTPQGTDYVDLIDSFLSLADTTAQSISSPITVAGTMGATAVTATRVEASAGVFTTVSANSLHASTVSASSASFDTLIVGGEIILPPSQSVSVGEQFLTATAAAIASGAGSYGTLTGTFSSISTLQQFMSASPTLSEITYTGSATAKFFATVYMSIKASAVNKLAAFRIGVNSSSLSRTEMRRFISSSTDVGSATVGGLVLLNPLDRVSFMCTNTTDTTGIIFSKLVFHVEED